MDTIDNTNVADTLRLLVILVGFTLAMACGKFTVLAVRSGESYRAWGLASYALLVLSPALSGLVRFGEPLYWPSTLAYAVGLGCGVMALRAAYTIYPEWKRMRDESKRKRSAA